MARRILILSFLLYPCLSEAQFIDAGFGTGLFGQKQFSTGLFGTGSTSGGGGGGGVPAGSIQDDSGNYLNDDLGQYLIAG